MTGNHLVSVEKKLSFYKKSGNFVFAKIFVGQEYYNITNIFARNYFYNIRAICKENFAKKCQKFAFRKS